VESLEEDVVVNMNPLLQQQMLVTCLKTLDLVQKQLGIKQRKELPGRSIKFFLVRRLPTQPLNLTLLVAAESAEVARLKDTMTHLKAFLRQ
jgi:hypothetical protein